MMKLERLLADRRPDWARLEKLLDEVEDRPDHEVRPQALHDIVRLYREACSDLNQARSLTADPEVLDRLNALVGRGYRFVYRRQPRGVTRAAITRFFRSDVPRTFRRERMYVVAAAAALLLGALTGAVAVLVDAPRAERLVPQQLHSADPKERVEQLEKSEERIATVEDASQFAAQLYTHNISVAFLAMSLGAATIVGGLWILFYNGVILGVVATLYVVQGVHVFFLAWVGPHGALEIPAIVFAGAAGLRAGRALLLPGERSTASSLRRAFPAVSHMLLASVAVLVVAGLIEGSFSQFTAKTIPYEVKIGVAALLFVALMAWLFGGAASDGEEAEP
jgi:uncharacterized membrane protein SpoIIM required for sporulation